MRALTKELERREALKAQAMGPSPLQRDVMVARSLVVVVRRAANSEDHETALSALTRLGMTVEVMQGETPAAQIRTYLERALFSLQGDSTFEADVASACALAALNVALKSPDAPLVPGPDTAKSIEDIKALVDDGEYKNAGKAIEQLIGAVSQHKGVKLLAHASAGIRGAHEAMAREAPRVALAELDELSDVFNEFATILKAGPIRRAEEEGEEEEGEEPEEPESTPESETASSEEAETTSSPELETGEPPESGETTSRRGR